MNDTISRLAVIQIIEKMRARIGHNLERSVGRAMIEILDEVGEDVGKLPPVQPEIIRCKDCKYWDMTWQNDYAPNYHYCPMIDGTHRNDFYCADAERREDG